MFDRDEERAGAYDFLESSKITTAQLADALFESTTRQIRAAAGPTVTVAIDGTALSLTDTKGTKDFGPVGSPNMPVRGVQVMNALAVGFDGVPLGLIEQTFWTRAETEELDSAARTKRNGQIPFEHKEPSNFLRAAELACTRIAATGKHPCFVIDREGDNSDILLGLKALPCDFVVRGKWDRRVDDAKSGSVRRALLTGKAIGEIRVDIPRSGQRPARTPTVTVRAARVVLRLVARGGRSGASLPLTVVWVREDSDEKGALEWLLYTNLDVATLPDALVIVNAYRARWRVEEFHRTWKQGECNVEDAQLRSTLAVTKWATLLSAVATRIERLKYLARTMGHLPASTELSSEEIDALKLDQRSRGVKKKRVVPKAPTIGDATRWVAELGGWIDQSGNGPPGATTLARGLERLALLVQGIRLAQGAQRRLPTT